MNEQEIITRSSIVAVAINGNKRSKHVVQWALEKFVPEDDDVSFKLLHVCPLIISVPTPMGNLIPIHQVRDDVVAAFRKEMQWQTAEKLTPYKTMCTRKKVQVELVQIESNDIVNAIAEEIAQNQITKLVIGVSSRNFFSRGLSLSSRIAKCSPEFCTVYAVSKGRLSSVRPSGSETDGSIRNDSTETNFSASNFSSRTFSSRVARVSSFRSSETSNQESNSDATPEFLQDNLNFELEKLRVELRHRRGMFALAQTEANDASRKLKDLERIREEEEIKFKEISLKEEETKRLVKHEKEKYEAAKREADYANDCLEREAALRKAADDRALNEAKLKEKLEDALAGRSVRYQIFTWEEIISATSSFSEDLQIGLGGYGTVYKCILRHTNAAVKVLHSTSAAHSTKQFEQELEVLSKIRHPHLLVLLGACLDRGCLVYEYMENGSLEDRLFRRNNSLPLPWFERFRIAWEVASALAFLHTSKPEPIIHRDIKPANILLDHNLVSKIGDVGLSTMLRSEKTTGFKDTGLAGTFCYIDPEYQRTGLISAKSDVYAFGIVILQLITAKPALGLTYTVEKTIADDRLINIVDHEGGKWPIEETKELAILALKCTELRRIDRPDLNDQVLPTLEKLKAVADRARNQVSASEPPPPKHFICPILKDVMQDPFVAADGYTYERNAIEEWLRGNNKSPMTNVPLLHKNLIPNYTLLSAITEWKSPIREHYFISDF